MIFAGVRVSTQMAMGIAAIAAYVKGPGLGEYIFTGLTQIGGANAINYAVVGTVGIILVALVADALGHSVRAEVRRTRETDGKGGKAGA